MNPARGRLFEYLQITVHVGMIPMHHIKKRDLNVCSLDALKER
ncbi:MAG TPA: hypothetical protein PK398_02930 [Candidatus Gracilibacteria bacterium]|nr:hypothetical protein [Candidatus Gracilibacteria bacterium]